MKRLLATTAIVCGALWFHHPAHAHIDFLLGNNPQQPSEQNILFTGGESGLLLTDGQVDHTGASVFFTTLGNPLQVLGQQSGGQAKITCISGCIDNSGVPGATNEEDAQLGSISMRAGTLNGQATAWGDAIIDLTNGIGTALVTVTDNFGAPFTYTLGHGSNFLTIIATPGSGEFITRIDVTNDVPGAAFGFNEFDQPRVSGLCTIGATGCQTVPIPAPEPATIALLGVGLLGTLAAARRKRS